MSDFLDTVGLSPAAKSRAREAVEETGEPVPVVVSRLGLLADEAVVAALSQAFGLDVVQEGHLPDRILVPELNPGFLKAHRALVLSSGAGLVLAVVDPANSEAVRGVEFATGKPVECRIIGFHAWRRTFDRLYSVDEDGSFSPGRSGGARWTDDTSGIRELSLDAPAVRLVETLVSEAADLKASDIHIERKPEGGLVRFRIDGRLQDRESLSPAATEGLIARLKVLGDLDVADHRSAQDGRTALSARGRPIDVRLAIIPSAHGEGAVVRLLDRADVRLEFQDLGFRSSEIARIQSAIAKPQGMFLVSGPTGGGKTTTLYAAVNALRSPDRKIVTVEDPIEYFFEDVHQTQLDTAAGLSFANALRAFLRYDPDVILVGEIRDPETAQTAVQAALTGHLVLSTIHANDAASVAARLVEMGVEPYLLAATLTAASAQRLVRRLCPSCALPTDAPRELLERAGAMHLLDGDFHKPNGCSACSDGYKGRLAIGETLVFEGGAAELVRSSERLAELKREVAEPMLLDGLIKASEGQTSVDEVLRALEAT